MTVESTTSRVQYEGNDSATEFAVPWQFMEDGHVAAVLTSGSTDTDLTLGVDFSLSGAGDAEGGTLTCPLSGAPLAAGRILTILSSVPLTQEKAWSNTDAIDVTEIEKADDKLTRICRQLSEELGRCLKVPVTDTDPDTDVGAVLAARDQAVAARDVAVAAEDNAEAWAAGLNLPAVTAGDVDKLLVVKDDASGYELQAPADVRDTLGLGTAAVIDTGTDEGDVVVLGAGGALPAVDGSALTGITPVPAGTVIWSAASAAPSGTLKANGAAVSRTTYAALFSAIGTTFGIGDGSTTFNLPDLRGEFVRGWDDGRGVDSGRTFGSAQGDANKAHNHDVTGGAHSHAVYDDSLGGTGDALTISTGVNTTATVQSDTGTHTHTVSSEGGPEARPRNIALLACIKY